MRSFPGYIGIVALLFILVVFPVSGADMTMPEEGSFIHYDQVIMNFDRADAKVTVSYELDLFAQVYVIAFGTRHIESSFEELFCNYEHLDITEIKPNQASLVLHNISRQSSGYYLHDEKALGNTVDTLLVIYPSGPAKTIYDASSVPNLFYEK